MVIAKRRDFRKRKKRELFFSPAIPLVIVLIFLFVLVILVQINEINKSKIVITGKPIQEKITGAVVSNLNLKTNDWFKPNEALKGNFSLYFYPGDLIPANASFKMAIVPIKCNYFYVCSDGTIIPWQIYNFSSRRCENVTTWQDGPWEECGEEFSFYPNVYSNVNCSGLGGKCCDAGKGIGYYYPNLNCSNKECWDDCSNVTIDLYLEKLVALSSTPTKGNYSYGNYSNVNGSGSLSGKVWGFAYCYENESQNDNLFGDHSGGTGNVIGYAISTLPSNVPLKADLIVTKIYVSEIQSQPPQTQRGTAQAIASSPSVASSSSVQRTKKVYAQILNNGTAPAYNFVVRACWSNGTIPIPPGQIQIPGSNNTIPIPPGQIQIPGSNNTIPIPPAQIQIPGSQQPQQQNCKEITISLAVGQSYEMEIDWLDNLKYYLVSVFADYYDNISESNENNNIKSGYIGCLDSDGNNSTVRGICMDINSSYIDYCENQTAVKEYVCVPYGTSDTTDTEKICSPLTVNCALGCSNGTCVSMQQQTLCQDSDGLNYYVKGNCTDQSGTHSDSCNGNILTEWQCYYGASCIAQFYNCSQEGKVCKNDACVAIELPDLIVLDVKRISYNNNEGVKIIMKNNGTAQISNSFKVLVNYTNLNWSKEFTIQNSGIAPGVNFSLDVQDKNIASTPVNVYVFVDSNNSVNESNEYNNNFTKYLPPYSCENWNNVYVVSLERLESLGLKAPELQGYYNLTVSLSYDSTLIYNNYALFGVQVHTRCNQDHKCVVVPGPGSNECINDSDCKEGNCIENWQYQPLTNCTNGKRTIECYDAENCGTIEYKPAECIYNNVLHKYIKTEDCCSSNWECSDWSVCYESQGSLVQSMSCQDTNRCDPQNYSSIILRDCCVEKWQCDWGACINGVEKLSCVDLNNCGTEFTKPQETTRACEKEEKLSFWVWFIIIIVIVAIVIILFITKVIKFPLGSQVKTVSVKQEKTEQPELVELRDYIKKAIAAGLSKEEIKKKLIEAGWPQEIVDAELTKV